VRFQRARPVTDRSARAVGLVGCPVLLLSIAALAATILYAPTGLTGSVHLPWFVLVVLFALAQSFTINIQVKREARSVSLSDAPFVLGLLAASPATFVLARVGGGVVAQIIARRQHREPVKLAFNTVTGIAEAAAGLGVFVALRGTTMSSPRMWVAAVLAAATANLVSGVTVALLIARLESDWPGMRGLAAVAGEAAARAIPPACVGLVAALALRVNVWAAVPLVLVCATLLAGYRAYARLAERHQSMERLYKFSQVVGDRTATTETFTGMLEQVCELVFADGADLTFFNADGHPESEVSLRRDQALQRRLPRHLTVECGWLLDTIRDGKPVLLGRDSKDVAARHWLGSAGLKEAMIVPLRRDGFVVGALTVIDRMGAARGFDRADLRLLETVANHSSIALRNGELMDRLRHDSLHDALTGIANRAYLQTEVDRMFTELENGGPPFAVAMLDLDSFKDVNDTLGHHHGDALLREVARRLTAAVEGRGTVTRFGGDEFAVLMPNCWSDDAIARHCGTMLDFLAPPVELDGTAIDVGASIGVARAPVHGANCDELVKRADMAMYVAKEKGRDVVIFDQSHDTASPSKLAMVAALRQAISDGSLFIHVQPQMRLDVNEIVSVEALVRWADPERGLVSPDEFIPLAERSGLIRPLTDFVLEKAVEACAGWQQQAAGVAIAVNLSARSLHDDGLDKQVERVLRRHGLPARLLTLEITESSVMADPARTLGLLHRLRSLGVRLSIDDFGTGYSSLAYLRRLPVNEIKVDRAFVQRMDEEADDAAIVRSIVELAHTLDLSVVAEGVENRRTMLLLEEMGCAMVQGFHLARPMPVPEFVAWYRLAQSNSFRQRLIAVAES
jgi:diguanylate cyclase (GGDEF)-like protein